MLCATIILVFVSCGTLAAKMDVIHEWSHLDYVWDSEEQKSNAIYGNAYDYTKIFTIDVQYVQDGRIFVTTPRFNPTGVPATLSTVSRKRGPGGPLLQPYPNWKWHNATNCKGMTSVWRVAVDECNRLWILDSGKIGDDQVCPVQVLIFDLRSNKLQSKIKIPNDVSHNPQNKTLGLMITPVIETEGTNCWRTWVYLADVEGGGLVILDGTNVWRITDPVFNPESLASDFSIAGETFNLPDGLFGLAVSPGTRSSPRRLYFRPLASYSLYSFTTEDLHRSRNRNSRVRYTTSNYRFPSQVGAQAFSRDGILFYGLTTEIAIACWNMNNPMDNQNVVIVAQDNETLQFASGVKVTVSSTDQRKEDLWVSTNRFQKIASGTQNFNEINFRILKASVDNLVRGSRCQRWRSTDALRLLDIVSLV